MQTRFLEREELLSYHWSPTIVHACSTRGSNKSDMLLIVSGNSPPPSLTWETTVCNTTRKVSSDQWINRAQARTEEQEQNCGNHHISIEIANWKSRRHLNELPNWIHSMQLFWADVTRKKMDWANGLLKLTRFTKGGDAVLRNLKKRSTLMISWPHFVH